MEEGVVKQQVLVVWVTAEMKQAVFVSEGIVRSLSKAREFFSQYLIVYMSSLIHCLVFTVFVCPLMHLPLLQMLKLNKHLLKSKITGHSIDPPRIQTPLVPEPLPRNPTSLFSLSCQQLTNLPSRDCNMRESPCLCFGFFC